MKTREQLMVEIYICIKKNNSPYLLTILEKIVNIIISACEEAVLATNKNYQYKNLRDIIQTNKILENLKKLKSK